MTTGDEHFSLEVPIDLTVITPTWDWERTIAQIKSHRNLGDSHANIVVWSGAPIIGQDNTILEIDARAHGLDDLTVLACKTRLPPVEAMWVGADRAQKLNPKSLLCFLHDDVEIFTQNWDEVLVNFFRSSHSNCGLAGFGGAFGLGTDDLYSTPYQLQQLIRIGYRSNAYDWAMHGEHLRVSQRVAVLDGLALVFRPEAYNAMAGLTVGGREYRGWLECAWNDRIPFHMYDAWACLRLARLGWEVWAVPIEFHHQGGGTSVQFGVEYEEMVRRLGFESGQALFESAHQTIYDKFRDVLPLRV